MYRRGILLSLYPAPYRIELFNRISEVFYVDVFLECFSGDSRNEKWFQQGKYNVLENNNDKEKYLKCIKELNRYQFVALYEYASITSIKLILRCRRYHIPYFINCDGVMLKRHGNLLRDIVKRYLIKGASGCFASGENAKQYFLKYGADEDKIHIHTFSELEDEDILKRPLSSDEKKEIRKELGLPIQQRTAIAVGRFIPLKRYDALIRAWKSMPDNYTLLLIGGGDEKDNYLKIIERENINNVIIKDYLPKERLFEYCKAADVFVHPTSYDVWGLVVNEAMACGLPVVVSDHCIAGIELIKNGENGCIVPMGNDQEMCQRVIEIMNDTELYKKMSKNALDTIRPYTMTNMASVQIDAIREIIGE